jgi:AraC-like DNA-binding protein
MIRAGATICARGFFTRRATKRTSEARETNLFSTTPSGNIDAFQVASKFERGNHLMLDIRDLVDASSASAEAPPPQIRFSLDGVPDRDRPAVFREFFGREVIKYDLEPLPDIPLDIDVTLQALPGLMMMTGRAHGSRNRRTRETLEADPTDDIGLVVNLRGPLRVTHGQQELTLTDGDATLVGMGEICDFTHLPPGDILALRVPRNRLAPLVTGLDDCCFRRIPGGTPALRLLTDYIKVAQGGQGVASSAVQHLVVNHVYDLMAVAAGATRDASATAEGHGVRAARLHAVKNDIVRNLDQAELSVQMLARRHGLTERYVQRLFEMEGTTFTEYVLSQRLAHAYRRLSDPRQEGEKISVVAWDSGFGDVSYFNRAFRRRFGLAPSDVRAHARQGSYLPN